MLSPLILPITPVAFSLLKESELAGTPSRPTGTAGILSTSCLIFHHLNTRHPLLPIDPTMRIPELDLLPPSSSSFAISTRFQWLFVPTVCMRKRIATSSDS
ncbi:hypothetical protein BD311DRAFT_766375 [Dichomitus squalens]|uniref:Uncharacterized protein n=1 Tax=Dichomitus squalens TaxID=114155 RepID=A0A4Q9MFA7_9APHY|nr:hypothetical protein BD311DRAFT_766375 [Dichomitus squalens]